MDTGLLVGGRVLCPWHNAAFSVVTGAGIDMPARDGLDTYPVEVPRMNALVCHLVCLSDSCSVITHSVSPSVRPSVSQALYQQSISESVNKSVSRSFTQSYRQRRESAQGALPFGGI